MSIHCVTVGALQFWWIFCGALKCEVFILFFVFVLVVEMITVVNIVNTTIHAAED